MTTLYEKVGRRYVPVMETVRWDALPAGSYLLTIKPGSSCCRSVVEADRPGWLAAAEEARDAMAAALRKATDCHPVKRALTARERQAYEAWRAVMGDETMTLERASAYDVVQAGLDAVAAAAQRRDANVRRAARRRNKKVVVNEKT